ncbi:MAG TPA: hypothetical protein VF146_04045 [Bryobacteraceae bacterium]
MRPVDAGSALLGADALDDVPTGTDPAKLFGSAAREFDTPPTRF